LFGTATLKAQNGQEMLGIWGYLAPLASPGYAYARAVDQIAAAG